MPVPLQHSQQLKALAQACATTASVLSDSNFTPALNELIDHTSVRQLAASAPGAYLVNKGVSAASGLRGTYTETTASGSDGSARVSLFEWCRTVVVTANDKTNFFTVCFGYDTDKGFHLTFS